MVTVSIPEATEFALRRRPCIGLVADPLTARRLEAGLEAEFEVVSCGHSPAAFDDPDQSVELIVLAGDGELLERGGAVEMLRHRHPDCRIVLVVPSDQRSVIRKALRLGVDGVVPYALADTALGPSVWAVLAGQLSVPQSLRRHASWASFSTRERQVLQLVADGLTNNEIARHLFLSESTVKTHLSSSFRKLGVSSRAEATAAVLDPDTGLLTAGGGAGLVATGAGGVLGAGHAGRAEEAGGAAGAGRHRQLLGAAV